MSRVNRIKQNNPDLLQNEEIYDIANQADKLQSLKTVADTEGGKDLIKLLLTDVVYNVNRLCGNYHSATHTELLAIIADMSAHLNTAKLLLKAKENIEILDKELQELLSD